MSTDDNKWLDELREHLDEHNPPPGLPAEVVREVRTVTDEAGQSARELFGPAEEYAALVAQERISESRRSMAGLNSRTPGALFYRRITMALGFVISVFALRSLFDGAWVQALSWRALYAYALVGIAGFLLYGMFPALRASGRGRTAWVVAMTAALGVIVGILTADSLNIPTVTLFEVPTVVLVGGMIALWVVWQLIPEGITDHWFAGSSSRGFDDETWLNRLDSLLRGRHGFSYRSAKNHVLETRQHLDNSDNSAEHEFGQVEIYARALADDTSALTRKVRRTIVRHALLSVVAIVIAVFSFGPGLNLVVSGIFLAGAVFLTWYSMLIRKGEVRP